MLTLLAALCIYFTPPPVEGPVYDMAPAEYQQWLGVFDD